MTDAHQDSSRLGGSQIFGNLSDGSRFLVERLANEVTFAAGATVFLQGDEGDALYRVIEGLIEISVVAPNGRKLSLNLMRPGDVFGEIALLDNGARTTSAIAVESCKLARIPRSAMRNLMAEKPEISVELIEILCGRLRWVSQQVEDQVFLPLPVRLAKRLFMLSDRLDGRDQELNLSQDELASFVGASRESTNKILNAWRRKRWIDMSRGTIKILDRSALTGVAEALD
jgi:CRP-like cAMP-binding protein